MNRLILALLPFTLLAGEPRYARLGEFQGKVEVQLTAAHAWMAAERNLPLVESAWLRTGEGSRLEIELDEGSAWRLAANSQVEISDYKRLSTGQRITMLSLDRGVAYFTGMSEGSDALMLAVPGAHVTISRGARVRMEVQDQWSQIAVIEGVVRFASPAAEMDLREGQTTRIEPANPARFFLGREVASMDLDRWSEERDKALSGSTSAAHVVERYGLIDLDTAGEWIQTPDLGAVWKPKITEGWAPFQSGRWRWYETVGYTWVSDEPWGWLPYHYGRWTRKENLGWVWAPAPRAIFKPGEVYWMRGAKLTGWGPLSPGEKWPAPENAQPQQYLAVNTVWAAFQEDAAVIDPAGFNARPKEPLTAAAFVVALPGPALAASRLDAVRPLRRAARARVMPAVEGVTFSGSPAPPPAPEPVTVASYPDPGPPPSQPSPKVIYAPPVVVPLPNILIVNPRSYPDYSRRSGIPPSKPSNTSNQTGAQPPAAAPAPPPSSSTPPPAPRATGTSPKTLPGIGMPPKRDGSPVQRDRGREPVINPAKPLPREKQFRDSGESQLLNEVVKNVGGQNYQQALATLDLWSKRYRSSEFADDRAYYYMQAYSGLNQPVRVFETGAPLMNKDLAAAFADPMQVMGVLYLTSLNLQKLSHPTGEQLTTGVRAAQGLLEYLPICFTPQNKPATVTAVDWRNTHASLATMAQQTIAMGGRP